MPSRSARTAGLLGLAAASGAWALTRWGSQWGSTPEERALPLPGDDYVRGGPSARVVMTRAITIDASPEEVWPWVAQVGRGAGFYSYDHLDNGGRPSARHIVSWIPEPAHGDATALGYLRRIEPGAGLTWWLPGSSFLGARIRMVFDFHLVADGSGTRLITRVSGDASGITARPVIALFRPMDSIMATRQLLGLRERIEAGSRSSAMIDPETGARDQYQLYEVAYASGEAAGLADEEMATRWRRAAIDDGVLTDA